MNTELELLKRIDERNYLTEREHREFYGIVEKALINAQDIKEENTRYKNLEEELGCPLEVFITALFNGFYDEFGNNFKCDYFSNMFKRMMVTKDTFTKEFYLKDYKKTWWLKKDKSE